MDTKRINLIFALFSFFLSFIVYLMTMAPTVSFWDCGEFIACSYKLAVPHPPGAPLYLLVGRIFTLIPEFVVENIAKRVNLISVISSALTVLFLYLSIVYLIRQYLKTQDGFFRYIPYISAMIGSLTFAFSHSFWFNAVEAEVYAPSMLFTGLVVWLIFRWSERNEDPADEKYLLLIAYLMGLAIGVHLLNVLAIPMVMMIVYYKRFDLNLTSFVGLVVVGVLLTLLVYPGIVKGIPWLADRIGFIGLLFAIIILVAILAFTINARQHLISLLLMSVLLITIGYSSYLMIYIRSNLNPNIDENNPETVEKFISYMNREQYGEHHFDRKKMWKESPNGRQYTSVSDFFWRYQINKMYVRYFLWNFGGIADDDFGFDLKKFWLIPLFLGFLGAIYHFWKDWKHGLAVGVLFFLTGLAIILYLNQPDPQPRERDYSYVGSFFAFAIWVGIGAASILEFLATTFKENGRQSLNPLIWLVALVLFLAAPINMLAKNYHSHDRTGNFVAWDYSYNMLISSEEGGIMFTNGDNDTFPLWYLQEVEDVCTDVRVANLSLLNTSWYIQQLKDKEPKVSISLTNQQISQLQYPQPWPEKRTFEIPTIPPAVRQAEANQYRLSLVSDTVDVPEKMSFEVTPKIRIPTGGGKSVGGLRIQDWMVLNILATNQFQKPLYFAVTTSDQNRLDGLKEYQRMDGLLFKITTIPGWSADPNVLYDNLMNKFKYRNLNNPDVYFNENIMGLLQNYRSAFFRLSSLYLQNKEMDRFKEVIQKIYTVMPPEVIPFTNNQFKQVMNAFALLADVYPLDSLNTRNYSLRELQTAGEVGLTYGVYEIAKKGYGELLHAMETSSGSDQVQNYLRSFFRKPTDYYQASEEQRNRMLQNATEQLRRQMVRMYKQFEEYDDGIAFLEQWLEQKPDDQIAKRELEEFKNLKENKESGA
jgi:hypothetical protein